MSKLININTWAGCKYKQLGYFVIHSRVKRVWLAKPETKECTSAALSNLFFGADAIRPNEHHHSAEVIEFIDGVLTITWDQYHKDVICAAAIIMNEMVAVKNIWADEWMNRV